MDGKFGVFEVAAWFYMGELVMLVGFFIGLQHHVLSGSRNAGWWCHRSRRMYFLVYAARGLLTACAYRAGQSRMQPVSPRMWT